MNRAEQKGLTREIYKDKSIISIILLCIILCSIYISFRNYKIALILFGDKAKVINNILVAIYPFVLLFFMGFIIPAVFAKFILKIELKELGLKVGNYKEGLVMTFTVIFVAIPFLWIASKNSSFISEYPLALKVVELKRIFIIYEIAYLLYYIGWEFIFRGFLQMTLKERFGIPGAIMVQTFVSCIMHIGKPAGELWMSIPAGIIFGIMTFKTGSILYALIAHWSIGVILDIFIYM